MTPPPVTGLNVNDVLTALAGAGLFVWQHGGYAATISIVRTADGLMAQIQVTDGADLARWTRALGLPDAVLTSEPYPAGDRHLVSMDSHGHLLDTIPVLVWAAVEIDAPAPVGAVRDA